MRYFQLAFIALYPALANAQHTPAQRFLERMYFYQTATESLVPTDSVETAVQLIKMVQQQPTGQQVALYFYRPALANNFYVKKLWLQIQATPGQPADTTWGEARLLQLPARLSAQLTRFVQREGNYVLPPHSVHYSSASPTGSQAPQPAPRLRERAYSVQLHQAPPYSLTYQTHLDPEGYESAAIIRSLGRSVWRYRHHQRRAYRQLLRLVRDFSYRPG